MAEVRLLGPLEVVVDGEPLALGGRKQRSVLAMLALDPNRVLSIDRLIDGVWGESAADGARRTLQVYVSNLRSRALRPAEGLRIESRAPGYVLEVDPEAIDLHRFALTSAEARQLLDDGRFAEAAARLDEAHALWRGAPLDDLALEPFAEVGGLERLHEARVTLLEDRVDVALALGRHEEAVAEAEALVTSHPLRERPWGQLMLALYRAGRQADALRAYGRARDTLVEELGIEPGPAFRDLEGRILGQDPELAPAARVATPVDAVPLASLPKPTAALVGRTAELTTVADRLVDPEVRLVTLVGPGGVGKTRLAVALAEEVAGRFPGGAAFVGLSAVDDAEQVLAAVAQALGVPDDPDGDVAGAIATLLGSRPALLVLDNLEQVVDAAPQVAALLGAAGALTVLATSRIALRISGEHEVPVGPLALPDPSSSLDDLARCESVEMFVSRCQARSPGFALTDANAADVAEICVRLDGLPLAIELAAARSKVLRPGDLRARLVDSLGVLVGGGKDLPDRHRTLRATLEWSYGLLEPEHQALLDRLGVFAGSFRLEGAEEVAADPAAVQPVLDGLTTLVDNSLVRPLDAGPALRFELLRAVRDFARERLAERGELDERRALHARHVLAEARGARDRLDGPDGPAATAELLAGDADQRAVFQHALETGDGATAAELAVALRPFWVAQGRLRDGRVWLAAALDAPDLPDATKASALVAAGALAYYQDDIEAARSAVEDGVALARAVGDDGSLALGLCFLASTLTAEGNLDDAAPVAAEALDLAAAGPAYEPHVVALSLAALLAGLAGDHDAEARRHEERLALARRQGDRARVADALNTLAEIALDDGRTADARSLAEEALALARATSRLSTRDVLLTLARIEVAGGNGTGARDALGEALVLCVEFGQPYELAQCLRVVASVAVLGGDADAGARLFGGAEAVQGGEDSAFPVEPDLAGHRDTARTTLGDAAFDVALGSGRALGPDGVLALAQEVTGAGRVSASASARSTPS